MTSFNEGAGVSQGPHAGGFETSECDADAVLRRLGTFFLVASCRTLAIYAGLVLSSPLVGFVAVAYDDKCFGCVTCLDKWVWFSTDSASAWTVSCNCLA